MKDDSNDMIPAGPGKKLPEGIERHLRSMMEAANLKKFGDQLPHEFLEDASEGLGQLKDSSQMDAVLKQLNQQMHHQLAHKKTRKRSTSVWDLSWTYWAIVIILLLTIVGFIVIRMYLK